MLSYGRVRAAHPSRRRPTRTALAIVACAASLTVVTNAQAATATWTCGADAVTASVVGMNTLNPVTAKRTPCSDQSVGLPNTTDAIGLAPTINAKTAYAITSAKPATARPIGQAVGGAAGVENLTLQTGGGTVVIGVGAAQSAATAACKDGKAVLTGTSQVVDLTINGQKVSLDGLLTTLTDAISKSPLGGVVSVKLNEQIVAGETLVQRAAHIRVLSAIGANPLADVIVAQSTVSSASACDPNADGNKDPVSGSGDGGGIGTLNGVCPAGSTLDTGRVLCIISASRTGGQGEIVIGRPFTGPSGGTVVSLINARKRYKSVCLSGPGPQYAIVGTNGANRITGRNTADRILALGGNDAVDGGRGNDCIDGGTGRDNLSGGIGNDRIYGTSGGDALNGGPGTDRLSGGTGNDSINAAFGADIVSGGAGVDFINVATAGPPTRVDCGSGNDKVRLNRNERRRVRNCETAYVFNDR
ncbi:MAG: calcium-binding protein [Solirubrobacterales bacterium]|nr:calcium-binding protein [Solirubrobacterales bacterium]